MHSLTTAHIHLDNLVANYRKIKKLAPKSRVMAMLKADAYGHGMVEVARTLREADAFAVARVAEAMHLRSHGITAPIVVLSELMDSDTIAVCLKYDLEPVLHNPSGVEILTRTEASRSLKVWLKVDTGMHRLGFLPEQFQQAYRQVENHVSGNKMGVLSHFSSADEPLCPASTEQARLFAELTNTLPCQRSICNSAGILSFPQWHFDWVRPGIMLYGINPLPTPDPQLGLLPVMTLQSRIIAVRPVPKGDPVGYNQTWRAPRDSLVATIGIGYGDGYPRHAPTGTPVLINGKRYPLIGRVSMDMITVDVTGAPEIEPGTEVTLWGQELSVAEVAAWCQTISYDLLTGITERVSYRYIDATTR